MGFTPMEAGARGAEGMVFVTGCPIRVLSGKGMNILCFPALARRPVAMQEAVSRNTSRNGYEGPTTMDPCDQDTIVPSNFSHICTSTPAIRLCGFALL